MENKNNIDLIIQGLKGMFIQIINFINNLIDKVYENIPILKKLDKRIFVIGIIMLCVLIGVFLKNTVFVGKYTCKSSYVKQQLLKFGDKKTEELKRQEVFELRSKYRLSNYVDYDFNDNAHQIYLKIKNYKNNPYNDFEIKAKKRAVKAAKEYEKLHIDDLKVKLINVCEKELSLYDKKMLEQVNMFFRGQAKLNYHTCRAVYEIDADPNLHYKKYIVVDYSVSSIDGNGPEIEQAKKTFNRFRIEDINYKNKLD